MKKQLKGIMVGLLTVGLLAGCSSNTDAGKAVEGNTEPEKTVSQESKLDKDIAFIEKYGKVTVLADGSDYTLEGNDNIGYEMSNVKVVKIEDITETGKDNIEYALETDSLPDTIYAVIGSEKRANKTDEVIEFMGIVKMVAGSKQYDAVYEDFVQEDNGEGSQMMDGVEMENNFGFVIEDPNIDSVKFMLASAFDSETFTHDYLKETTFKIDLTKVK